MSNTSFVSIEDIEKLAKTLLSKKTRDYYADGANNQCTLEENRRAFERLRIRPRFLRDVSARDMTVTILGQKINFPIGVSPSAYQRLAHPDGEIATAKAISSMGSIMILSTSSSYALEDVIKAVPNSTLWFQLYVFKNRQITKMLIKRAERCGFKALVLTADTPISGFQYNFAQNGLDMSNEKIGNFEGIDLEEAGLNCPKEEIHKTHLGSFYDTSLTWDAISWIRTLTSLPVVVKGILTGEDAEMAIKYGASAIMVSNHGGRQLDGVPATIEVLPEVVKKVNGRCEIYLDSGVRTGTDILKAIALGAKAVFIGRPVLWGLTSNGEDGVKQVLQILKNELDLAMALSGCKTLKDIQTTPSLVVKDNYYSRL
ncbi:uncharacterized protein LOC143240435 [Tachypleus tridentatus]|uniref:uncharacterized protein LOC143240435 n=1 Tax=Tachypleus tridentatus TaxID=6853 RepID=UPI003FD3BC1C